MNQSTLCKFSAVLILIVLLALMHSTASADSGGKQSGGLRGHRLLSLDSDEGYAPLDVAADPEPVVKRIEVSLSQQHLIAWENDRKAFEFAVTTGAEGQETIAGDYEILDKEVDAYSDAWQLQLPFWMGIYQYGEFENGFHALPIGENGKEFWRDALGNYPASHGCIVLSPEDAETLFNWTEVGVKVEIHD